MKTVEQVLANLDRRLGRVWPLLVAGTSLPVPDGSSDGAVERWPWRVPTGRPDKADLTGKFPQVQSWARSWIAFGAEQGVAVETTARDLYGSRQTVPTHMVIPDLDTLARILGGSWPSLVGTARVRWAETASRFPARLLPAQLRAVTALTDDDYRLLLDTAAWFASHDAAGLTPRQVPVMGVHSKWLEAHRSLVLALSGKDTLGLVARPTRAHFTYLDPTHRAAGGRLHDSRTLDDLGAQPVYPVKVAIISENKDTAVYFPPLPAAISMEGNGHAGPTTLPRIDWMHDIPALVYWGDIDTAGYEIVNAYRANGLPISTVLMGPDAYSEFAHLGVSVDRNGSPLPSPVTRSLPHLTDDEQAVYRLLCSGSAPVLRIEQERIPLSRALVEVQTALAQAAPVRASVQTH